MFLMCIVSFTWRTSPVRTEPPPVPSDGSLLAVRLVLTLVIVLAVGYGILVLMTFSRYGEEMDQAWKRRIKGWLKERAEPVIPPPVSNSPVYSTTRYQPESYQPPQESAAFAAPDSARAPAPYTLPEESSAPTSNLERVPSDVGAGYDYTPDDTQLYERHTPPPSVTLN